MPVESLINSFLYTVILQFWAGHVIVQRLSKQLHVLNVQNVFAHLKSTNTPGMRDVNLPFFRVIIAVRDLT